MACDGMRKPLDNAQALVHINAMTTNLEWIWNLPEVGPVIRDEAKEIQWQAEQAAKRFEEAKRLFEEAMQSIADRTGRLEASIERDWSTKEIDAAKRGETLWS